jgi:hypothetical protein
MNGGFIIAVWVDGSVDFFSDRRVGLFSAADNGEAAKAFLVKCAQAASHDVDTFEKLKALEATKPIAADLYVVDAVGAEAFGFAE